MPLFEILVLAVVQGITEFLPISSSGHLRLASVAMGLSENTLVMDVAVHVGTLLAVLLYFWRDIARILAGFARAATGRRDDGARLGFYIVVATLPIVVAGYFGQALIENSLRGLEIVGWTTLVFGLLLWVADRAGMTVLRIEHMRLPHAVLIGLSQILALVPGTSRAGITMTAARMLGYERADAARFSMLLSIPAVVGAGLLVGVDLYRSGDAALTHDAVLAGGLAFATALVAIAALMRWLRHAGFGPFVVYRVILGLVILGWVYGVI